LRGTVVVRFFCITGVDLGTGDTDCGNAPGISSFSCKIDSLTGAVRGVRVGASCESDTRLGVDEFLFASRAELRLAMAKIPRLAQ
jgi:hypothetical protein